MSTNNNSAIKPCLFGWNELITSGTEAAKQFYAAAFGWTAEVMAVAPGLDYTLFKLGDTTVGGMIRIAPDMATTRPHPPSTMSPASRRSSSATPVSFTKRIWGRPRLTSSKKWNSTTPTKPGNPPKTSGERQASLACA